MSVGVNFNIADCPLYLPNSTAAYLWLPACSTHSCTVIPAGSLNELSRARESMLSEKQPWDTKSPTLGTNEGTGMQPPTSVHIQSMGQQPSPQHCVPFYDVRSWTSCFREAYLNHTLCVYHWRRWGSMCRQNLHSVRNDWGTISTEIKCTCGSTLYRA